MSEVTHPLAMTANGDLPTDAIERAVTELIAASDKLHGREAELRAALDEVRAQRTRLDKAVTALTAPVKKPGKPGPKGPRGRPPRKSDGISHAAPGYPNVSEERQGRILAILRTFGRPVHPSEITNHPDFGDMSKGTTQNALAHLRARGLVRWAGRGKSGGHLYAVWAEGDTEDAG